MATSRSSNERGSPRATRLQAPPWHPLRLLSRGVLILVNDLCRDAQLSGDGGMGDPDRAQRADDPGVDPGYLHTATAWHDAVC